MKAWLYRAQHRYCNLLVFFSGKKTYRLHHFSFSSSSEQIITILYDNPTFWVKKNCFFKIWNSFFWNCALKFKICWNVKSLGIPMQRDFIWNLLVSLNAYLCACNYCIIFLQRRGPQRSVNTIVSSAFILEVTFLSLMCVEVGNWLQTFNLLLPNYH